MQDSKEEKPPSAPEEIVKLSKYKIPSDANPREIFWAIVQAYSEGGEYGALAKKYVGVREALVNIGCSVLSEEPRNYRIKITRSKLALCIFAMIAEGGWGDVLERVLSNLYERTKGPDLNMLLAFGQGFSSRKEVVGGWLKELLTVDRPPESVLAYIAGSGDREMVSMLKQELLNIARTEINEPQIFAMEALSVLLPKDAEVAKLFLDMMDDWDLETKKITLETLSMHEIPDAGKKAVALYPYEQDEKFKMLLERIAEKNKEGLEPEFMKLLGSLHEKELEEVSRLAEKVLGKKAAKALSMKKKKKEKKDEEGGQQGKKGEGGRGKSEEGAEGKDEKESTIGKTG